MKILTVVGARPQLVKAAVVSRAIAASAAAAGCREVLVHTGQHYDDNMSEVFFREMRIPAPAHYLGISGGSHGQMTGRMLERIEEVLLAERPEVALVYGDTNSTLAGALAAAKLHIPVAHVEAGLRSFNLRMPEEINRIVADRLSRWLLCPTETSVANLLREAAAPDGIHLVGDVMYDAALFYEGLAAPSPLVSGILDDNRAGFCLATVHRAENTDDPDRLAGIVSALDAVAGECPVVLPLHPRTRKQLSAHGIAPRRVRVIEPVGYFDMISLLKGCKAVFTDSGGLQKEAYFFRRPCVTMRSETEWVELVSLGVNFIAGTTPAGILAAWESVKRGRFDWSATPYGDGRAGERIVEILLAEAGPAASGAA